jgi:hypothetical protein
MHHQGASHHGDGSAGHHGGRGAHANHAAPGAAAPDAPGPAMHCACGEELRALHPADAAVPLPADTFTPTLTVTDGIDGGTARLPTIDLRSFTPPPRA